jgi:hypothetical protein
MYLRNTYMKSSSTFFLVGKEMETTFFHAASQRFSFFLSAGTMMMDGPLTHSRMTIYYCLGTFSTRLKKHNV